MERRETKLWTLIRNGTKKFRVHWTRIENLVDSGTPDTWGVFEGKYFPVELKMEVNGWVYMRPAQVSWMRLHLIAGGQPWILFRQSNDVVQLVKVNLDFLSLLLPKKVHNKEYLAFSVEVFSYAGFKKPYDYKKMLDIMTGKLVRND